MIYCSPEFLLLFVSTLILYPALPGVRSRSFLLLTASLVFYAWAGWFNTVVFAAVVVVSWAAAALSRAQPSRERPWLNLGIGVMVLNLLFWKYAPWLSGEVQRVWPSFLGGRRFDLALPLGISFFTLQGIAYLVDLGRGDAPLIPFGRYLLFKGFFAQLVAGPIVRARQLAPQLELLPRPRWEDAARGLSLFVLGFAKKIMLADKLAPFVDNVFNAPSDYGRATLLMAVAAYTVQIWADFSGYTDMGRGAARMLGLELPENFLSPYLARSPSEFWRRWHVTLSLWIRDYLAVPAEWVRKSLAGRGLLGARGRVAVVLVAVMTVCGFWHGARWTFVAWGIYHGLLLASERLLPAALGKGVGRPVRGVLGWAVTLPAVMLGWLLFRSPSLGAFFEYLRLIVMGSPSPLPWSRNASVYAAVLVCAVLHAVFWRDLESGEPRFRLPRTDSRAAGACAGLALAALFIGAIVMRPSAAKSFIYFRF